MSRFIVIGITDHPQPFFPPEVQEVIRRGKVFSGGKRHHDIVAPLLPEGSVWIDITVPLSAVFEQYLPHEEVVVFASGDPLFFGFANTLQREFPDSPIKVFPSFNSLQMLAHRLVMPYHDMRIVSLTGRPWKAFDRALIEGAPKIGILTDKEHTPATIARRMLDYGYTHYQMHVGEHLGNPTQEKVTSLSLEEAARMDFSHPNCLILGPLCCDIVATTLGSFGIPDSSFSLLDGREKMITKMPIRLLTLQALDLPRRHTFWDIGFCTGSVSIEARLLFPHLDITAFEIRPEGETLMHENTRRHHAPGITTLIGDFCSVCSDALATTHTPPDAAFIGGHGGKLKDIMAQLVAIMPPQGRIVMNSVTAQSHQLWDEACEELHLTQLSPLHIQLNDFNPITILSCELPSSPSAKQA